MTEPTFRLTCTCREQGLHIARCMEDATRAGAAPAECQIHPIVSQMGNIEVSTILRQSSAAAAHGHWYEETLVFRITADGSEQVDQCTHHFEAVRKWFGGDHVVYEAAWREADSAMVRSDASAFIERVQQTRETEDGVRPDDEAGVA